jgi:5'-phosphate synthase pdxT subunit
VTSTPTIGVLALQGDVREHVSALERAGARARTVRQQDDIAACDALVIPGGESTTMSRLASIEGWFEPLRLARATGMPMFGTCAGMIMLADSVLDARADQETVGGLDIVVRRNAFGRQVDSFEADLSADIVCM